MMHLGFVSDAVSGRYSCRVIGFAFHKDRAYLVNRVDEEANDGLRIRMKREPTVTREQTGHEGVQHSQAAIRLS